MSRCHNKNTVEYQALKNVYKTDLVTGNVIDQYQAFNNTESIPTTEQAADLLRKNKIAFNLKQRDFGEALLNNLRRQSIIHSYNGEYYIVNTNPETLATDKDLIQSNIDRLYEYLSVNNISRDSVVLRKTAKTYAVSIDSSLFSNKDMLEVSRSWDTPRARKVVMHLMKMFPDINVKLMSVKEAKEIYDLLPNQVPFNKVNSFYYQGYAVLIKGRVTDETAIEEILHPFIDAIKIDNIALFEGLLAEAKRNFPELTQQIIDSYNKDRKFTAEDRDIEVLTQALSRHFNNEYEKTPTRRFKQLITDLLEWFKNIIVNLQQAMTGVISVDNISPNATLTDIAKLLNTEGIRFDYQVPKTGKVRYSLSPEKKKIVNVAKSQGRDIQNRTIDRLFHNVSESKNVSDTLSGSRQLEYNSEDLVILNKEDGKFYNLSDDPSSRTPYISAKEAVGIKEDQGTKALRGDVKIMLDAIAGAKTFADIKDQLSNIDEAIAEQTFNNIVGQIETIREPRDVLLTNVVFHDKATQIAAQADIVLITESGKFKVLQVQMHKDTVVTTDPKRWIQSLTGVAKAAYERTSPYYTTKVEIDKDGLYSQVSGETSLTQYVQDSLELNIIRRLVENMGYEMAYGEDSLVSLHTSYKGNKLKFNGHGNHATMQNLDKVDMLIPDADVLAKQEEIDQQVIKDAEEQIYKTEQQIDELEGQAENIDPAEYPALSTIAGALESYEVALIEKQKAFDLAQNNVFMDRQGEEAREQIASTIGMISVARAEGPVARSTVYTRLLQDALRQMKSFSAYINDPKNLSDPKYINYVLNFQRFLETFEGLYEITDNKELNATQRSLVSSMEIELRKLLGTKVVSKSGKGQGLVNDAILDYVEKVIKDYAFQGTKKDEDVVIQSHGGMEFTLADLRSLVRDLAPDISKTDLYSRDLSTNKDAILATMDKIVKFQRQEFLDRVEKREKELLTAGQTLQRLSPEKDVNKLYDWMLEYDENGDFTGLYVQRIGQEYNTMKQELRGVLYDENGKPYEYYPIYSLENANPKEVEFNKDLYLKKKAFRDFMSPESYENGELGSGRYHQYKQEFIDARKNFEYFQPYSNGEGGRWVKKRGADNVAYNAFRAKYYQEVSYTKMYQNNGNPTGAIKENQKYPDAVKPEYVEVKDSYIDPKTGQEKSLLSEKYQAIMNPKDALGEARKAYYEMFVRNYEELLDKLPRATRGQMLGKVPIVRNNFADEVKAKPSYFVKLIPNFLRSIKNLFVETSEQKMVLVNKEGNLVDTLPVFYTGNARAEDALEVVYNKLADLKAKRVDGAITANQYAKEKAKLQAQAVKLRSQPTLGEISTDMTTSLLKFSKMAENFEVMGEVEGTLQAMVKAIEMRTYTTPDSGSLLAKAYDKAKGFVTQETGKKNYQGLQSNAARRAHHYMKMVYYDNAEVTKGAVDNITNAVINLSSLTYVAFNIFGNINNATLGQVNNWIEGIGGLYFTPRAYADSEKEFLTKAMPNLIRRTGYVTGELADLAGRVATLNTLQLKKSDYDVTKPVSKWEWLVDYFRMMDAAADLREVAGGAESGTIWERFTQLGYSFNQGAEYMVQSKVGMAILKSTMIKNSKTGETLSLDEAFDWDRSTGEGKLREGFDTVIDFRTKEEFAYDRTYFKRLRNNIREVNKQIHGNYAREDRMVIQANFLGKMIAQFHKWTMPAYRARFQGMYYDANLGWLEGRYMSLMKFINFVVGKSALGLRAGKTLGLKELGSEFKKEFGLTEMGEYSEEKANMVLKNVYRSLGEAMIIMAIYAINSMLRGGDPDDDELTKKLKNWGKYQADRTYKEMILFVPIPGLGGLQQTYQMAKTPIAATRTLGEFGEALEITTMTGVKSLTLTKDEFADDSSVVYQNRPRKGQLKLYKNWADVIPLIYTIQKWGTFDKLDNFYIK